MIETYGHQKLEQRLATAIAAGSRVEATQLQGELLCLGQVALPESISVWSARQVDTTAGSPQAHLGALFAGNRDFGFNQPRPSLSPSQSYQTGPNGEIIIDAWPLSPPQDFVRQARTTFWQS